MSCGACGGVRLGYCLMRCMAVLSGAWNSFLLHFLKCSLPPRLLSCKLWKMCVSIQGVDRAAPAMCQEQWLSKSRIWDTIWVCDCSCRATAAHPLISASVAICAHCPSTSHCLQLIPAARILRWGWSRFFNHKAPTGSNYQMWLLATMVSSFHSPRKRFAEIICEYLGDVGSFWVRKMWKGIIPNNLSPKFSKTSQQNTCLVLHHLGPLFGILNVLLIINYSVHQKSRNLHSVAWVTPQTVGFSVADVRAFFAARICS